MCTSELSRVICGTGLHTGEAATVRLRRAQAGNNSAVVFQRRDSPDSSRIPARVANLRPVERRTVLGAGADTVQTTEHLLSALWAFGAAEVEVEVMGRELPILDAASAQWCDAIESWWGDTPRLAYEFPELSLPYPVWVLKERGDPADGTFVLYLPPIEPGVLRLTSIVPLDAAPGSPVYSHSFDFRYDSASYQEYRRQIAFVPTFLTQPRSHQPDGTFGHRGEFIELRTGPAQAESGQIWRVPHGNSADVREAFGPHGQGPAQHKNLDLLGDIAVLANECKSRLTGWFVASRHGHQDTAGLLRRLLIALRAEQRVASQRQQDLLRAIETCRDRELRKREGYAMRTGNVTDYSTLLHLLLH